MERIQALIDKLYLQKQQNANPAQMLFTVQLLQTELMRLQQKNGSLGTAKVAVTLPVNMNFSEEVIRTSLSEVPDMVKETEAPPKMKAEPVQVEKPVEVETIAVTRKMEEAPAVPTPPQEYLLRKPAIPEVAEDQVSRYAPKPQQVLNPAFNTTVETPTLVQHQPPKELHELISEKKESMNDRLKEDKKEVVHSLKDTPIKDLRKGIGINDRFTFVSELFRGDDAMYERSIKTINSFHILSEAEYWINRELKFKLGWNDSKDTVQHFYHLVRRRFA